MAISSLKTGAMKRSLLVGNETYIPLSDRAIFGGGYISGDRTNVIDYIDISTTGNATDFGDLVSARDTVNAYSSTTRGIIAGGANSSGAMSSIEYVTIATAGNATSWLWF
jgi:hypothetical protein